MRVEARATPVRPSVRPSGALRCWLGPGCWLGGCKQKLETLGVLWRLSQQDLVMWDRRGREQAGLASQDLTWTTGVLGCVSGCVVVGEEEESSSLETGWAGGASGIFAFCQDESETPGSCPGRVPGWPLALRGEVRAGGGDEGVIREQVVLKGTAPDEITQKAGPDRGAERAWDILRARRTAR